MNPIEKYNNNIFTLNVYGTYEEPLFKAVDIARLLGYTDISNVVLRLPSEYKKKITVVQTATDAGRKNEPPRTYNLLTENGLYYLIMRCDLPKAKPFQKWVCCDVLPSIRKKGYYAIEHKQILHKTNFKIETEFDLHSKVVDFIRSKYPDALFTASLGELQDSSEKRIKAYNMGYTKGECDLSILNLHKKYSGFIIEFKSPTGQGIINKFQSLRLKKYRANGFKTLLSNDYDTILLEIADYMANTRIKCPHCAGKFRNSNTLKNHLKYLHKITE